MQGNKSIRCLTCRHFYITWDKHFPNGCRLFGVKSRLMPSIVVSESIGHVCDHYIKKELAK